VGVPCSDHSGLGHPGPLLVSAMWIDEAKAASLTRRHRIVVEDGRCAVCHRYVQAVGFLSEQPDGEGAQWVTFTRHARGRRPPHQDYALEAP
jgi:hypothetical protein